jgi:hypothetical protein
MRITRSRAVVLVLAVGVLATVAWRHYETMQLEHRLAGIASVLAGRPVHVHCQGSFGAALDVSNEAGTVEFDANGKPADVTDLSKDVCDRLSAYPGDHTSSRFDCVYSGTACPLDTIEDIYALQTLAHESAHLAGNESEAVAECDALQTTAYVAEQLGASPAEAEGSARVVAFQIYPQMPDEYQSSDCRDGGSMDLHPDSPIWP